MEGLVFSPALLFELPEARMLAKMQSLKPRSWMLKTDLGTRIPGIRFAHAPETTPGWVVGRTTPYVQFCFPKREALLRRRQQMA